MIYSALDWSGGAGRDLGRYIVLAVTHVDDVNLGTMQDELNAARRRLGWPDHYVFKHSKAKGKQAIETEFYQALARLPFSAHIHMFDKEAWYAIYGGKGSRGEDLICDAVWTSILKCPDSVTAKQTLYIDVPHNEPETMRSYQAVISAALRGSGRKPFCRIKPRSDSRRDGSLVQMADMLCGEVAENGGLAGPWLPRFTCIDLV